MSGEKGQTCFVMLNDNIIDKYLNNKNPEGLTLIYCVPNSRADIAGLKTGDKIIAVNNKPVRSLKDYLDALKLDEKHTKIEAIRNKAEFLEFNIERLNRGNK